MFPSILYFGLSDGRNLIFAPGYTITGFASSAAFFAAASALASSAAFFTAAALLASSASLSNLSTIDCTVDCPVDQYRLDLRWDFDR